MTEPVPNAHDARSSEKEVGNSAHDQGPPHDHDDVDAYHQRNRDRKRGYFQYLLKGVALGIGKKIGEQIPEGFDDFWDMLN